MLTQLFLKMIKYARVTLQAFKPSFMTQCTIMELCLNYIQCKYVVVHKCPSWDPGKQRPDQKVESQVSNSSEHIKSLLITLNQLPRFLCSQVSNLSYLTYWAKILTNRGANEELKEPQNSARDLATQFEICQTTLIV